MSIIDNPILQVLTKLILIVSVFYIIFNMFSLLTWLILAVIVMSTTLLLYIKYQHINQHGGIISKLSPKLRTLLQQKSIFDIYSDLLYYPLITKIIAAFIKPTIVKPHPLELHHAFDQLPVNVQKVISTKGLLHLAPQKIQNLVLANKSPSIPLPANYGKNTWEWYRLEEYQNQPKPVHQQTLQKKIVSIVDEKVSWRGIALMGIVVLIGIKSMKTHRFKKMMIQNGSFTGILLLAMIVLLKAKGNSKKGSIAL